MLNLKYITYCFAIVPNLVFFRRKLIFIPFILLSIFIILNVFIGIVVNSDHSIGEVSRYIAYDASASASTLQDTVNTQYNMLTQDEVAKDKLSLTGTGDKVELQKELDALILQITKFENLLNK